MVLELNFYYANKYIGEIKCKIKINIIYRIL